MGKDSIYELMDSKTKGPLIEHEIFNGGTIVFYIPLVGSGKDVKFL